MKINFLIGIICYVIAFILVGYYLILEFSILNLTSPWTRLRMILIVILLMFFGCFFLRKIDREIFNKLPKVNIIIWFILYVIMLLNLTLFDQYFGRDGLTLAISDKLSRQQYFEYNFNIVPFATINNYLLALKNGNLANMEFSYNIYGNLVAFIPMAFFLPRLFKKIDNWFKYFIIVSVFIVFIELVQMLTMSGSFDIDDYLLNILGSMLFYIILNNGKIKQFVNKLFSIG